MIGTGIGLGLCGNYLPTARDIDPTVVLDLPFATTKSLAATKGPTPSFSRASTGTYFDSNGILQTAAIDVPRFDHFWDGTAWVCRGLRVDGQTTNFCLWNRDLTNAAWTKTNITAAKNQTGIDGVANSASSISATANLGTVSQNVGTTTARPQFFYVKRLSGSGTLEYSPDNGATWYAVTVTSSWARATPTPNAWANNTGTIVFRIGTSGDSFAIDHVLVADSTTGNNIPNPIETTSSAATLSNDICVINSFSGWLVTGGTVYAEWFNDSPNASPQRRIFQFDKNDGVISSIYTLRNQNRFYNFENTNASVTMGMSRGSASQNVLNKIAGRFAVNDSALVASYNQAFAYDTTCNVDTMSCLRVGNSYSVAGGYSISQANYGCIGKIKLWNVPKIDADLLGLVT